MSEQHCPDEPRLYVEVRVTNLDTGGTSLRRGPPEAAWRDVSRVVAGMRMRWRKRAERERKRQSARVQP